MSSILKLFYNCAWIKQAHSVVSLISVGMNVHGLWEMNVHGLLEIHNCKNWWTMTLPNAIFCNTCIFTYIKIWKFDSVIVSKTSIPIKICAQQILMKPQYIHANDGCTIWCSKESHNKHLSFMKHMNHFLFSRYVCLQRQGLQPRNEMEGWLRLQLWVSRWHDRTICLHRNVSGYIASVDTLLND